MPPFKIGDRVRVASLSAKSYAGQTGEVVQVSYTRAGSVCSCLVRLDGKRGGARSAIRVVCSTRELEPEPD
jgi:hypothetical protein